MITEKFKGDADELKMEAVAAPAFALVDQSKDEFFAQGFDAAPFILMLYDEGRMPFSDRVPRDAFVAFAQEALPLFTKLGTFDAYFFILRKIFGEGSEILFDIPAAGKLDITINADASTVFDAIVRQFNGTEVEEFQLITDDGTDQIVFRGIAGIDTEFKLQLMLAEIQPAGIYTTFTLTFFTLYTFIGEDTEEFSVITSIGDSIVFYETGGA